MGYCMAKYKSNSGTENPNKQERLAKALRSNLLKRKTQSRIRSELEKDNHKEKRDG